MPHQKQWFQTWFNTQYYEMLYQHRNTAEAAAFIDTLLNFLKPAKHDARILDAACGNGRHSLFLAKKGFQVFGIDISAKKIKEARALEQEDLIFYKHDMRKILGINYFDYIFNFFTSFGYFEKDADDLKTIQAFAAELKTGGVLVIDFMNSEYIKSQFQKFTQFTINDLEFHITKSIVDNFIKKEILIIEGQNKKVFYEYVKLISLNTFEYYFAKCGLKLKHLFGDYSLNQYNTMHSERLILIAEK